MASIDAGNSTGVAGGRLDVLRCGLTGATVAALLFALCWIGGATNMAGFGHMYFPMIMAMPGWTIPTLIVGLMCSAFLGLLLGAMVAVAYNAFAFVSPPGRDATETNLTAPH